MPETAVRNLSASEQASGSRDPNQPTNFGKNVVRECDGTAPVVEDPSAGVIVATHDEHTRPESLLQPCREPADEPAVVYVRREVEAEYLERLALSAVVRNKLAPDVVVAHQGQGLWVDHLRKSIQREFRKGE